MNWPAWEIGLLAEFLSKEPAAEDRIEASLAQLAALYVNAHRKPGSQPHRIREFLLFDDAWKAEDSEPEDSLEAFALSFGQVKRGTDRS